MRGPEGRWPNVSPAAEALGKGSRKFRSAGGAALVPDLHDVLTRRLARCRTSGARAEFYYCGPSASAARFTFGRRASGPPRMQNDQICGLCAAYWPTAPGIFVPLELLGSRASRDAAVPP